MKYILILLIALLPLGAFANLDYALTEFTASTTSSVALLKNTNRKYLLIQNNGSVSIHVKFGSVHSGTEGVTIVAGGNYEPYEAPVDAVYIRSASSTAAVTIYSGN